MKNEKKFPEFLKFVICGAVINLGSFFMITAINSMEFKQACRIIDSFENKKYMTFELYGNSINSVSGRFTILDQKGMPVADIERSWNGSALNLEYKIVEGQGKKFVFPLKIKDNNAENKNTGVDLFGYYFQKDGCVLLNDKTNNVLNKNLLKIYRRKGRNMTLNLTNAETGKLYEVYLNPQGQLDFFAPEDL